MPSFAIRFRASLKDRYLLVLFALTLLALGLNVALLMWKLPAIGEELGSIALHYNIFFGVDRVGDWRQAVFLPAFGALCLVVNFAIAVSFNATERFVSRTLAVAALVINMLLVLGSLFIILANI